MNQLVSDKQRAVLAIDTSTTSLRVGLVSEETIVEIRPEIEQPHSRILPGVIQNLMSRAESSAFTIEMIAVNAGPGSLTGIRVGMATAMGLGDAWNIPVISIPAADLWAISQGISGDVVVLLPGPQGKIICARKKVDLSNLRIDTFAENSIEGTDLEIANDPEILSATEDLLFCGPSLLPFQAILENTLPDTRRHFIYSEMREYPLSALRTLALHHFNSGKVSNDIRTL
jgi:tRNA threonylcarbamoyl adenosine modification protein YeaZ